MTNILYAAGISMLMSCSVARIVKYELVLRSSSLFLSWEKCWKHDFFSFLMVLDYFQKVVLITFQILNSIREECQHT